MIPEGCLKSLKKIAIRVKWNIPNSTPSRTKREQSHIKAWVPHGTPLLPYYTVVYHYAAGGSRDTRVFLFLPPVKLVIDIALE
jgi:hypothetical protein